MNPCRLAPKLVLGKQQGAKLFFASPISACVVFAKRDRQFFAPCLLLALILSGCTPSPHDMVARGQFDTLKKLIQAHPERINEGDRKGKTPLHMAVGSDRMDMLPWLVQHRALIEAKDITGMTPLHVAAMLGRREATVWLLEHGADWSVRDTFGDTPLHTAAVFGQGGVLQELAARGAPLNDNNTGGKTPLDLAMENRHERLVALLRRMQGEGVNP